MTVIEKILAAHRVTGLRSCHGGFDILTSAGALKACRVVLATGGRSLPKTGSDGGGYEKSAYRRTKAPSLL